MYNINNFTAVCGKYVHFTLHLLCCLLVHPDKFLILCKWLLRYYYWTYYSDMRHGDRPHNYVSNYIFGFAISSGLTKILPIEKCIIFFETPCSNNVILCGVNRFLKSLRWVIAGPSLSFMPSASIGHKWQCRANNHSTSGLHKYITPHKIVWPMKINVICTVLVWN